MAVLVLAGYWCRRYLLRAVVPCALAVLIVLAAVKFVVNLFVLAIVGLCALVYR
jgi:lipopolysaccharide export LptBFGC system permease protein LptF